MNSGVSALWTHRYNKHLVITDRGWNRGESIIENYARYYELFFLSTSDTTS